MSDQYQKLAKYYDDFVQKKRDYQAIANQLAEIIGDNINLLEIGIGTGLIVECLLKVEPRYNITGVDNSQSLLDIAKNKLGEKVHLHCQSVSELNIDGIFDVAYSRGGAWTFIRDNGETMLASHILNLEDIQKSFYCVAKHLREGGLLIISSSNAYGDNLSYLDNGILHKRTAKTEESEGQTYAILDYFFYKDEELLAQQTLKLRLLSDRELTPMLKTAGLVEKQIDGDGNRVYVKTSERVEDN